MTPRRKWSPRRMPNSKSCRSAGLSRHFAVLFPVPISVVRDRRNKRGCGLGRLAAYNYRGIILSFPRESVLDEQLRVPRRTYRLAVLIRLVDEVIRVRVTRQRFDAIG